MAQGQILKHHAAMTKGCAQGQALCQDAVPLSLPAKCRASLKVLKIHPQKTKPWEQEQIRGAARFASCTTKHYQKLPAVLCLMAHEQPTRHFASFILLGPGRQRASWLCLWLSELSGCHTTYSKHQSHKIQASKVAQICTVESKGKMALN